MLAGGREPLGRHVQGEIVSDNKLECLANHLRLGVSPITMCRLEHFREEGCSLKVVVDEEFEASLEMTIEILGESRGRDTLHTS